MYWKNNISSLNRRLILRYSVPELKVFSDASSVGLGAFFDNAIVYRNLDSLEVLESSCFRELVAIQHSLLSFPKTIEGKHLLWYTDNLADCKNSENR